jgi:hypothetical protein
MVGEIPALVPWRVFFARLPDSRFIRRYSQIRKFLSASCQDDRASIFLKLPPRDAGEGAHIFSPIFVFPLHGIPFGGIGTVSFQPHAVRSGDPLSPTTGSTTASHQEAAPCGRTHRYHKTPNGPRTGNHFPYCTQDDHRGPAQMQNAAIRVAMMRSGRGRKGKRKHSPSRTCANAPAVGPSGWEQSIRQLQAAGRSRR